MDRPRRAGASNRQSSVKSRYSASLLECLFGSTETRPAVSQLVTQEEASGMEK